MTNESQTRIRDTMTRMNLDATGCAQYLGVPVHTLTKWVNGTRTPSASVLRLLDVLGTIEALAPAIHVGFLPENVGHVGKSKIDRSTDSIGN